jgi:hypothetical protein
MKKKTTDAVDNWVDRRSCLKSLGALAWASVPNGTPSSFLAEPAEVPAAGSDMGTLFPEIQGLADQCHYPLSWRERDYSGVEAYRQAAREKAGWRISDTPGAGADSCLWESAIPKGLLVS